MEFIQAPMKAAAYYTGLVVSLCAFHHRFSNSHRTDNETGALELHGAAAAAAANQIPAEIWYMMVPGKGGDMPQMLRSTPLTSQPETRERPGAALAV